MLDKNYFYTCVWCCYIYICYCSLNDNPLKLQCFNFPITYNFSVHAKWQVGGRGTTEINMDCHMFRQYFCYVDFIFSFLYQLWIEKIAISSMLASPLCMNSNVFYFCTWSLNWIYLIEMNVCFWTLLEVLHVICNGLDLIDS